MKPIEYLALILGNIGFIGNICRLCPFVHIICDLLFTKMYHLISFTGFITNWGRWGVETVGKAVVMKRQERKFALLNPQNLSNV